ncbi:MAG: hypothetical protein N2235_08020 [Fischerella sp.]|nr:hypothetical protein [Fischerella sp.]
MERRILTDAILQEAALRASTFRCATLSMTKSNSYFKSATPKYLIDLDIAFSFFTEFYR